MATAVDALSTDAARRQRRRPALSTCWSHGRATKMRKLPSRQMQFLTARPLRLVTEQRTHPQSSRVHVSNTTSHRVQYAQPRHHFHPSASFATLKSYGHQDRHMVLAARATPPSGDLLYGTCGSLHFVEALQPPAGQDTRRQQVRMGGACLSATPTACAARKTLHLFRAQTQPRLLLFVQPAAHGPRKQVPRHFPAGRTQPPASCNRTPSVHTCLLRRYVQNPHDS